MNWATHVLQWELQKATKKKFLVNLQRFPQFRLWTATRPHEVGITSNRKSARCGEHVNWPCTHRPSLAKS